jgi:hypothetical protein
MNTSWKVNLGPALEVFGVVLGGQGLLSQVGTFGSKIETGVAIAGAVIFGIGKALTVLFPATSAATTARLASLQAQVSANATSIITKDPIHAIAAQATANQPTTPAK